MQLSAVELGFWLEALGTEVLMIFRVLIGSINSFHVFRELLVLSLPHDTGPAP